MKKYTIIFISLAFSVLKIQAQDYLICFVGTDEDSLLSNTFSGSQTESTLVDEIGGVTDLLPQPEDKKINKTFDLFQSIPTTNEQSAAWLWAKSFGGNDGINGPVSAVDSSGNIYSTGFFSGTVDFDPSEGTFNLTSAGSGDIFISKTDGSGNFVWAKQIGGSGLDKGVSIMLDANGNICTTGSFVGAVDFDSGPGILNLSGGTYIAKFDVSGNLIWVKAIGGADNTLASAIASGPAGTGEIYITGQFRFTVDFDPGPEIYNLTSSSERPDIYNTRPNIYILKLDSLGNFVWVKAMNGGFGSGGISLTVDNSGNVYTTGNFSGTVDFDPGPGIYNLTPGSNFISKLDHSGKFVWAKQMDGITHSIAIDNSGNVYTTGYFSGTVDFDPGADTFNLTSAYYDVFISKLDNLGNFVWAKKMGGRNLDSGQFVVLDNDGYIYTVGGFAETADFDPGQGTFNLTSAGEYDFFISKLDNQGNFVWAKSAGGLQTDGCSSIAFDGLGNAYATGAFFSNTISLGSTTLVKKSVYPWLVSTMFIAKLGNMMTGIESVQYDDDFTVYPNPCNGKFKLRSNTSSVSTIEIYDIQGNRIYSDQKTKKQSLTEIYLTGVAKGIYLMKIHNGKKNISKKIVIQ